MEETPKTTKAKKKAPEPTLDLEADAEEPKPEPAPAPPVRKLNRIIPVDTSKWHPARRPK